MNIGSTGQIKKVQIDGVVDVDGTVDIGNTVTVQGTVNVAEPVTVDGTVNIGNTPSVYTIPLDGANLDAFARQRFSFPYTLFDSKQIFDSNPLFWDDAQTSGSGTASVYNSNQASSTLSVSTSTAGTRVRQTKMRFDYQPGKSLLIIMTGVLGSKISGVTKRVGYFDSDNGVFFELNGSTLGVAVRSKTSGTAVDTVIPQSSWNIDKLDGTGASGITLDTTKSQIFFIDFEWLGVGRVRYGFFINGIPYYVHHINNANVLATVYMSTPNLPLRYEISNSGAGAAANLTHICSTVISEGGVQENGIVRSVDRAVTGFATANNQNIFPLLSIRLKSTHLGATVIPQNFSVFIATTASFRWMLLLNPTIAGVDAASWTDLANSSIQYDISRTNVNTLTGGVLLDSGYATSSQSIAYNDSIPTALRLGATIGGTRDELILALQLIPGTVETVYAALTFREIY